MSWDEETEIEDYIHYHTTRGSLYCRRNLRKQKDIRRLQTGCYLFDILGKLYFKDLTEKMMLVAHGKAGRPNNLARNGSSAQVLMGAENLLFCVVIKLDISP